MTKRNRRDIAKWATVSDVVGLVLGSQDKAQSQLKLSKFDQFRSVELRTKCLQVTDPDRALDKQKFPPHGYSFEILYQVTVGELRKGDILIVAAESEMTSEHKYALKVGSFVTLGKENHTPNELYASGKHVCFPAGSDMTNILHHQSFARAGSLKIDDANAGFNLNTIFFLGYADSTGCAPDFRDFVTVEDGYGHLSVIHIRPINV
jgi:hypothetical protein